MKPKPKPNEAPRPRGIAITTVVVVVAAAAVVAVALAGCGSPITVTGTFGKRTLNVAGTAVGWIDETEYIADDGGGTPVLHDRSPDAVVLHLMFTEAVFDPRIDLRTLTQAERDTIASDIARGDRLFVDVSRGSTIRPDDDIELVKNDGSLPPEVLPFISKIAVVLGDRVVDVNERYPDRVEQVASDMTAQLTVTQTSPELTASLEMKAKKAEGETDGFLEGKVTVGFHLELLPERLAECNFAPGAAGIVGACDLSSSAGDGGFAVR